MAFLKSVCPSHIAAPLNKFWVQIRYPKQLDRFFFLPDIKQWPQLELNQLSEKNDG